MSAPEPQRDTWEQYASAWKVVGAEAKRRVLAESTHSDCTYTDPLEQLVGHDALIQYMITFHEQVPGGHFVTRHFQLHHHRCVAMWDMVDGSGAKLGDGVSFGEFAEDGKLRAMTGFFETPPETA